MAKQRNSKALSILIADDDEDDRALIRDAFKESAIDNTLDFVEDGQAVLDYLNKKGKFSKKEQPEMILLDINMPKKNGLEVLKELKNNPSFKKIPVVMLTTSNDKEHVEITYDLGGNSFITKPSTYKGLLEVTKSIRKFWFETAELPASN